MSRLFGTDGVRGVANDKLTPELALSVGLAAGRHLRMEDTRGRVLIGLDTRRSGPMLAGAFAAGLAGAGFDAVLAGVVPTGLVSHAVRTGDFVLGAVISASHNPAPDNGIKLLGPDGRKLTDEVEKSIEVGIHVPMPDRPVGAEVGLVLDDRSAVADYMAMLAEIVPEGLGGMRLAVDGANGAAYELGPEVLRRLGAEVVTSGCEPDGMNINLGCGATHPATIQELTRTTNAHLGIAFDGDADRVVFSDSSGRLINGDRTIGAWCAMKAAGGELDPPVAVGTVMSNGGFEAYLDSLGVRLERAAVGDKHVARRMEETGARIGGEQSGHIIFADRGVTGDGLITALEFLRVLRASGGSSTELFDAYEPWPQVLVNVTLPDPKALEASGVFSAAFSDAQHRLAGVGRVNVRPSGTQPMVRVMVEAREVELRDEVAAGLVRLLEEKFAGRIYSRVDLTHSLGE